MGVQLGTFFGGHVVLMSWEGSLAMSRHISVLVLASGQLWEHSGGTLGVGPGTDQVRSHAMGLRLGGCLVVQGVLVNRERAPGPVLTRFVLVLLLFRLQGNSTSTLGGQTIDFPSDDMRVWLWVVVVVVCCCCLLMMAGAC